MCKTYICSSDGYCSDKADIIKPPTYTMTNDDGKAC